MTAKQSAQTALERNRTTLARLLTEACHNLGVNVIAPYRLLDQEGRDTEYPVFIPEFGSLRGTVIDIIDAPRTAREIGLGTRGNENYIGRSFINLASVQLDPLKYVVDMLGEWGYYGDAKKAPDFMKSRR